VVWDALCSQLLDGDGHCGGNLSMVNEFCYLVSVAPCPSALLHVAVLDVVLYLGDPCKEPSLTSSLPEAARLLLTTAG
jgi:hypothetical protein